MIPFSCRNGAGQRIGRARDDEAEGSPSRDGAKPGYARNPAKIEGSAEALREIHLPTNFPSRSDSANKAGRRRFGQRRGEWATPKGRKNAARLLCEPRHKGERKSRPPHDLEALPCAE